MKKLSQGVALVVVTTLFATAFTTAHRDTATARTTTATVETLVAQVVVTGKRMTALEKAQYDSEMLASSAVKGQPDRYRVAVK